MRLKAAEEEEPAEEEKEMDEHLLSSDIGNIFLELQLTLLQHQLILYPTNLSGYSFLILWRGIICATLSEVQNLHLYTTQTLRIS